MNIPFELIFIVLFFVLPALSSLVRRFQGRGQPRPPARRPRPARPPRADTSGPSASTETTTDTNTDIPRWLEEAQRRVREAQQSETDQRGRRGPRGPRPQTAAPQTPRPQTRPAAQPRPAVTRPAATSLEDYRPEFVSLERTPARRPMPATAPPLRVQRLGNQKSATLGSYKMRFDEETLMTGFVWHQILSPPLSKRRNTQSQRRP